MSSDLNNSNFDVLATGTQDLAALVGIFASDSVEPYAFNYSRGWLSPLASTLSLLGVLGYIRGLVKLGLGREGCLRAGFDVKAERTFFGIPDDDWLPPGALYTVTYLQRRRNPHDVSWSVNRRIKHTSTSMPILRGALSLLRPERYGMTVKTCLLGYKDKSFRPVYGHFLVPLVAAISVGLTTLTIVPLRGNFQLISWTWCFATIGMFFSLFSSFLLWSWVYAQEMLPHSQSEWADKHSPDNCHKTSLEKRNYFAYIQSSQQYVTFELRAIKGNTRWLVRIFSLTVAVVGIISYICQYIELRAMSSRKSAIWLAIQGALALIRVLIWVVDPAFDDLESESENLTIRHSEPSISISEEKLLLLRLSKLDKSILEDHTQLLQDSFNIPMWVLDVLDLDDIEICAAFELAHSLFAESPNDPKWSETLEIFQNAQRVWDFPAGFLDWWIEGHVSHDFKTEYHDRTDHLGCRIIEDTNGRCHYLPYFQRLTSEFQIFGDPRVEEKTLYTCVGDNIDLISAHRHGLQRGWPSAIPDGKEHSPQLGRKRSGPPLQQLNTQTPRSRLKVPEMWGDLLGILRRDHSFVFRKQADFLQSPSSIGISSKLSVRREPSTVVDIENLCAK